MIRRPPRPTLFPSTPLFRSCSQLTAVIEDRVPVWVELYPGYGAESVVSVRGERSTIEEIQLSDLLSDRKSTRLNSSHANISYAVFCLKKKNNASMLAPPLSS